MSASQLKPSLILGSGFRHHVFGDSDSQVIRPLFDWHHLIDQVAIQMQVAIPDKVMSPVERWETLLLRAAREGFRSHAGDWRYPHSYQTHLIEKEARRGVATVLDSASENYPRSSRAQIPNMDCWGAVISLNFDSAWLPAEVRRSKRNSQQGLESKKIGQREKRRLTINLLISGVDGGAHRRVWFPNGSCTAPETIHMSLHDYGAAATAIQVAFAQLKQWKRDSGVSEKSPDVQLAECAVALRHVSEGVNDLSELLGKSAMPLTWVADFLYRPLVFAGVGMADQEAGLWWLLAQRARNMARTGAPSNAYILVGANDRTEFWRIKPFGRTPITCSNWDKGWERALSKAKELDGG